MVNKFLAVSIFTVVLTGCNTLDGLNSKSNFDCKAPDGVVCDSMTGVMANAKANNLPGQQVNRTVSKTPVKGSEFTSVRSRPTSSVLPTMEYTGAPILRNPKTLRIWTAPWEGQIEHFMINSFSTLLLIIGSGILNTIQEEFDKLMHQVHQVRM